MSIFTFTPSGGLTYDSPTGVEGFGVSRGIKRRSPFGEEYERPHRITKLHSYPAYPPDPPIMGTEKIVDESTLAPIFRKRVAQPIGGPCREREQHTAMDTSRCWVCTTGSVYTPCTYCERAICGGCLRQCNNCQGSFCSFCTTINYDARYDRTFCLACNDNISASGADSSMDIDDSASFSHMSISG